jgi:hypothetical protein
MDRKQNNFSFKDFFSLINQIILNIGNLCWESFLALSQLEPAFLCHSLRND